MKFKLFFVIILLTSCSANYNQIKNKTPFNSKGFAYIYNEQDFNDKLITGKLESSKMQVSINKLKTNSLIKIINPKTKDYLVIKNTKRITYPDFYKILINKEGKVEDTFSSLTKPTSQKIIKKIEKTLKILLDG